MLYILYMHQDIVHSEWYWIFIASAEHIWAYYILTLLFNKPSFRVVWLFFSLIQKISFIQMNFDRTSIWNTWIFDDYILSAYFWLIYMHFVVWNISYFICIFFFSIDFNWIFFFRILKKGKYIYYSFILLIILLYSIKVSYCI